MRKYSGRILFLALLASTICSSICPAATDLSSDLQAVLIQHKTIPGIVAIVVNEDRVTAAGVAGVRKAGDPTPFTIDDQIHLGSDTKAMTAVLIGQLIEQNKLTVETPMSKIFPELAEKMDPQMADVTVAQLLQHTAGLPANLPWGSFAKPGEDIRAQRHAAVVMALSKPPLHPPGSAYLYSNTGFVLLGAIVEKISGKSWEDEIRARLFEPLGMKSAGFGPPGKIDAIDEPWGHIIKNDELLPLQIDNPPVMGPAGRVHCTIKDWAKFVCQFEATENHLPQISARSLKLVMTPGKVGDYGGGWIHTDRGWGGGPVLTHAGSNTIWYCVTWIAPRKHFATLVAVNVAGDDAAKACDDFTGTLISLAEKH